MCTKRPFSFLFHPAFGIVMFYFHSQDNCFTAVCILSGTTQLSWYQKKHLPAHTYHGLQSSVICFLHLLRSWHTLCSIYLPDSLFAQSLSKFFLVYLYAWHPPFHIPNISSSNHCLLFTAHAHTIETCFAAVPRLCHLILVPLSALLGTLSCSLMPHIHLTILVSSC